MSPHRHHLRRPSICAATLACRRTHRIGGAALIAFGRSPERAVPDLLAGRDPLLRELRVQTLPGNTLPQS